MISAERIAAKTAGARSHPAITSPPVARRTAAKIQNGKGGFWS